MELTGIAGKIIDCCVLLTVYTLLALSLWYLITRVIIDLLLTKVLKLMRIYTRFGQFLLHYRTFSAWADRLRVTSDDALKDLRWQFAGYVIEQLLANADTFEKLATVALGRPWTKEDAAQLTLKPAEGSYPDSGTHYILEITGGKTLALINIDFEKVGTSAAGLFITFKAIS